MKQKLLLLMSTLLLTMTVRAVAPNSYVDFMSNGLNCIVSFNQYSNALPSTVDLGMVYSSPDNAGMPNIAIDRLQVVTQTDREGYEYETGHRLLVYIGVYDSNIRNNGAYYDSQNDGLYLQPMTANQPVAFGNQFIGGSTPAFEPMSEVMSAESFIATDGSIHTTVLPAPLVYDEQTTAYKTGKYQKGHTYVVAIHFVEECHWSIEENSGTSYWHIPYLCNEYPSFYWNDHTKECLRARFTYGADESMSGNYVSMQVNGEQQRYDLAGIDQEPIDLGVVYKDETTGLPAVGFEAYAFGSWAPVSANNEKCLGTMVFTTCEKDGDIDAQLNENFVLTSPMDCKSAEFKPFITSINCFNPDEPATLSEDWTYNSYPVYANLYPEYKDKNPVMLGWVQPGEDYDWDTQSYFHDGQAYSCVFYFGEAVSWTNPTDSSLGYSEFLVHRNGGKFYRFYFTYKAQTISSGIESAKFENKSDGQYYSVAGHKVAYPMQKMVYIKDGKKFINK